MSLALSASHPAASCSDQELVSAIRRGSDRAFEELYARYRGRIVSYIFGLVGDHGRTEDIAQDVFMAALRRIRKTDAPIAFKPWVYEIARNACIDEFRRTRRKQEVPLQTDSDAEPEAQVPVLRGASIEAVVERRQSLADLRGAFHGLSDGHRTIITMREFEGLAYDEIGERMGLTRAMVESTLFRARRRLGEEYEELVSGRRCRHVQLLVGESRHDSLRKLGIRERRQVARHLAHCQPCRRHARLVGADESLFEAPSIARKLAGLLPLPVSLRWLPWRKLAVRHGSSAKSFNSLQSVQSLGGYAGAAGGAGRAVAAIAALAIAGVGGGVVTAVTDHHSSPAAPPTASVVVAPALPAAIQVRHVHAPANAAELGYARSGPSLAAAAPAANHVSLSERHAGRAARSATVARADDGSGSGSNTSTPPGAGPGSGGVGVGPVGVGSPGEPSPPSAPQPNSLPTLASDTLAGALQSATPANLLGQPQPGGPPTDLAGRMTVAAQNSLARVGLPG